MEKEIWYRLRNRQRRITKREEALNDEWFAFFKRNKGDLEQLTTDELVKLLHQLPMSYPRMKIAEMLVDRDKHRKEV